MMTAHGQLFSQRAQASTWRRRRRRRRRLCSLNARDALPNAIMSFPQQSKAWTARRQAGTGRTVNATPTLELTLFCLQDIGQRKPTECSTPCPALSRPTLEEC